MFVTVGMQRSLMETERGSDSEGNDRRAARRAPLPADLVDVFNTPELAFGVVLQLRLPPFTGIRQINDYCDCLIRFIVLGLGGEAELI